MTWNVYLVLGIAFGRLQRLFRQFTFVTVIRIRQRRRIGHRQ